MEDMPIGSNKPAHRMTKRNIAKPGLALVLASCLSFVTISAAQSSTSAEESAAAGVADDATPDSLFPAPGQPTPSGDGDDKTTSTVSKDADDLRVATLHADITADPTGEMPVEDLIASLSTGNHTQARAVAQTVQINDPDVIVLTGVTYDKDHRILDLLQGYFAAGQHSESGVDYPYSFTADTNSGRDSGVDLDGDGTIGGPGDAVGYGDYAGQYGTVIFSKYPIVEEDVRTFREFLWSDLPNASMPRDEYSSLESSVLRLNETSMWDVPLDIDGEAVHVISSSVASPPDASNAEREDDMRRVIADYVEGRAWYLYDDDGETGHMTPGTPFVMAGVPAAEAGEAGNLDVLLESPVLRDTRPEVVTEVSEEDHPASVWASDQVETRYGNPGQGVRASFVLPSTSLDVNGSGVFWPAEGEYGYEVVDPDSVYSLEDRLVWLDLTIDS